MFPLSRRVRGVTVALTAVTCLLGALGLVSCSGSAAREINYVVDGTIPTYNTNTVIGAASGAPQAFSRVLTGFNYHGPDGQMVGDHDFGTISVVGRSPLVLDYEISPKAVYSDGKPVTCDDMVLTWAAQSGRFPAFDAASRAGYSDVTSVDCQPGQKKARVSLAQDRMFLDFPQLFDATSLMPSHVIADQLGLDVTTALHNADQAAVARIAEAWNTAWNLNPDLDLKRFPSSGPYKLKSVHKDGSVQLVANDKWWGAKPVTSRIVVWPRTADIQDRINNATLHVVDVSTGSSGTLTAPDEYTRSDSSSGGVEQLIFSSSGPMASSAARHAVASCTPRDMIAKNAAAAISNARLDPAADDAYGSAETTPDAVQFTTANPDAAKAANNGQPLTVRIGYQAPNARLAATVGAIAKSCALAGIVIQDAASPAVGPLSLRKHDIDILLASTGGSSGSGSSGSSAIDAYALHTDNGNNLSGYSNDRIDGIIAGLAVTSDPKELARLLADAAPILWADMPTLPLYRQQRTLVASKKLYAVSSNPSRWGAGWNMDRWVLAK
jgi:peptide/nickel transport system substrate-binding protein